LRDRTITTLHQHVIPSEGEESHSSRREVLYRDDGDSSPPACARNDSVRRFLASGLGLRSE